MIPSDPEAIKKMEELAARNIANGDWGDEVVLPGAQVATSPAEQDSAFAVSNILGNRGRLKLPRKKT